jgi:hypothetical protein
VGKIATRIFASPLSDSVVSRVVAKEVFVVLFVVDIVD